MWLVSSTVTANHKFTNKKWSQHTVITLSTTNSYHQVMHPRVYNQKMFFVFFTLLTVNFLRQKYIDVCIPVCQQQKLTRSYLVGYEEATFDEKFDSAINEAAWYVHYCHAKSTSLTNEMSCGMPAILSQPPSEAVGHRTPTLKTAHRVRAWGLPSNYAQLQSQSQSTNWAAMI